MYKVSKENGSFFHQQTFEKLSMTKYTTCSGCKSLIRKCAIFTSETDLGIFFMTTYNIYSGCCRFNRNVETFGATSTEMFSVGVGRKENVQSLFHKHLFEKLFMTTNNV